MRNMGRTKWLLRVARAQRDISQVELARRSGLSQKKIWAIEHFYRVASAEEQAAIATALEMTPTAIVWTRRSKETT